MYCTSTDDDDFGMLGLGACKGFPTPPRQGYLVVLLCAPLFQVWPNAFSSLARAFQVWPKCGNRSPLDLSAIASFSTLHLE